jgi:predicted dehydrogenase/threonine dehydrogenase-like Zn-dependent dehydrogenase
MLQLTQKLLTGAMAVQEVPLPLMDAGRVLVRNHYSLISAGTEGSSVRSARRNVIGKARERPQQVRQVIDVLRRQGPVQTYRAIMTRLDAYSPLGYSCAGQVIGVGRDVRGIGVGDKVACAGAGYAGHAEVVCVPEMLCVRVPDTADLRQAAYNTLGAVALQGIRQAEPRLAESCLVIGLGLLGQLTCLMLRANGVTVMGVDTNPSSVDIARAHCVHEAWARADNRIPERVRLLTSGLGADAVIITAGTASADPVNLAGQLARKKGRVVVVGVVPTGFDREAYYKKELELRMSCSYGPGRYDPDYEEKGIDYAAAYVRWTENRNMQAFQDLIHSGRVDLGYLTTHEFPFEDAPKAYDMIVNRSEPFLGVVLKYDVTKTLERRRLCLSPARPEATINIAFVGAGSYAQSNLLPHMARHNGKVTLAGVMTNSGTTSKRVSERFGFRFCTSEPQDIFANDGVNTIFVATRHDSHARYVAQALRAGKHVFVEKPLCLTREELAEIEDLYRTTVGRHLMIGFNRRFAPYAIELKRHLGQGPISILYRVNAGLIPPDHWIQDKDRGGGRILGEACHFIDFCTYLCGALPRSVHAAALSDPQGLNDTVSVNLEFADGSIAAVCYFANGSRELPKEYIEAYNTGLTGIIRDFKELEIHSTGKPRRKKSLVQDKGQARMVREFIERIDQGGLPLISPAEIFAVTRATFAVQESLRTRQAVSL